MEKKIKFSENPTVAKAVYGGIIALLCITAIVIGIVAANSRRTPTPEPVDPTPPITDGGNGDGNGENGGGENGGGTDETEKKPVIFISPVSGTVMKPHSTSIPVYSETLEEWRIHTGIDISTAEDADVFAAAGGEVTKVYSHPMLGQSVEITHSDGSVSRYSNLSKDGLLAVGSKVTSGEKIGTVGDSAISEIADEAHLHFEILVDEKSVDPLEYMSEEAKRVSLGITDDESAA